MARLKKQIRLEHWISTKDSKGDFKESISVKYNLWAEVKSKGAGSFTSAGQISTGSTYEFTVNFRPDLYPSGDWKVVYQGERYSVESIERKDEDRFSWIITAK